LLTAQPFDPADSPRELHHIKEDKMSKEVSTLGRDLRYTHNFECKTRKRRNHSKDLDVDGWIITEQIIKKQGGKLWTGFVWLRIGTSGEPSRTLQ
jgi:hypothetical protein